MVTQVTQLKQIKKQKVCRADNTTLATSISKGMKILLRTVKRESHITGLLLKMSKTKILKSEKCRGTMFHIDGDGNSEESAGINNEGRWK